MSSVVISGDTSGAITLAAPSVSGTNTITLPASTGTVLTTGSPQSGGVIQVVQSTYSTAASTTSSTFTSTGLSASITPKFSTSKVLILVYIAGAVYNVSGVGNGNYQVQRGGTAVAGSSSATGSQVYINTTPTNNSLVVSFSGLDSPATTSSTTYTVYMNAQAGTIYAQSNNLTSYIQLLEVAA